MHAPVAIIPGRFQDHPNYQSPWTLEHLHAVFASNNHLGVRANIERTSMGHLDLSGSTVFDWITIPLDRDAQQQAPDGTLGPMLRGPICHAALHEAAKHYHLDGFDSFVVFAAPEKPAAPFLDVGATSVLLNGRWRRVAFLAEGTWESVMAHEVGHALGFYHSFGAPKHLVAPTEYADAADVMGNLGARFSAKPDMSVAGKAEYFTGMGPGFSAATLLSYLTEAWHDNSIVHLDASVIPHPRKVRIHARDSGTGPQVLVVDWPDAPAKKYVVEYRRPSGWDWGIRDSWVRIHTLMNLQYPKVDNAPILRAELGIWALLSGAPPVVWEDPGEDFAIRLDKIADDRSWVEVTVGGRAVARTRGVRLLVFRVWEKDTLVDGGPGREVLLPIPPACGTGSFGYAKYHVDGGASLTAMSWGFIDPVYTWTINGKPMPAGPATIPLLTVVEYPEPVEARTQVRTVDIRRSDTTATDPYVSLVNDPADGNYSFTVAVSVAEAADPTKVLATRSADVNVIGQRVELDEDYEREVAKCAREFQDIAGKYVELKPFDVIPSGDLHRNWAVLEQWRDALEGPAPALAALYGAAAQVFAARRAAVFAADRISETSADDTR